MKIFIVPYLNPRPSSHELISQLARIHVQRRQTVPVVVVEDRYNLTALAAKDLPVGHAQFELEDFRHDSAPGGTEPNMIAQQMDKIESDWIFVDFGLHEQTTCTNFIMQVARYNYTSPRLRNRNLIFLASTVSVNIFARAVNECFNNLPVGSAAFTDTRSTTRLYLLAQIERALLHTPLFIGTLRRAYYLFQRIFRRIARAA